MNTVKKNTQPGQGQQYLPIEDILDRESFFAYISPGETSSNRGRANCRKGIATATRALVQWCRDYTFALLGTRMVETSIPVFWKLLHAFLFQQSSDRFCGSTLATGFVNVVNVVCRRLFKKERFPIGGRAWVIRCRPLGTTIRSSGWLLPFINFVKRKDRGQVWSFRSAFGVVPNQLEKAVV